MSFFRPAGGPKEALVTVVRVLRSYSILFLILTVLFAGTAFATDYPLTVTDDLGREVVLEAEPLRVVSMMPSQTETVCALGACDRLVGVDEYSTYPAEVTDLPVLGNGFSPNVEAIVALKPDLVLVDESGGIAETLSGLGLTVYAGTAQTYDEIFDTFEVVGELLNLEAEAASLSDKVSGEVDAVAALVADAPVPTVFYELDATPYSVGPGRLYRHLDKQGGRPHHRRGGDGRLPAARPGICGRRQSRRDRAGRRTLWRERSDIKGAAGLGGSLGRFARVGWRNSRPSRSIS